MNFRPIRTDDDYRLALATVDSLWKHAVKGSLEGDHLEIWHTLIHSYEREHYPIPPPDPIEAIKFRIEQMGIGRKGLVGILGSRARVAEVLAGTRALSIAMIRRLHQQLGIPADILIRESPRRTTTRNKTSPAHQTSPRPRTASRRLPAAKSLRTEKKVA